MIEVINGVNIDWSKFKVEAKGKHLENAKEGFTDFVLKADEVCFYLDSDYTSTMNKVTLRYKLDKNIKIETTSNRFKRQTYKRLKNIINNTNGDKFIRISRVNVSNRGQDLIVELQENLFETKFETRMLNYNDFVKSRETTYKYCIENNITVLSAYLGDKEKILVDYNCEHKQHWITSHNLKKGQRCPRCSNVCPIQSKEEFCCLVKKEGYVLLGEYIKNNIKVKLQCPNGHIFEIRPSDFKNGIRCSQCKNSKGEKKISEWCKNNNLEYETQRDYFGLKDKISLRYDIYIPSLNWLIEYDGIQHFEPIDFAGKGEEWAIKQFKDTQRRDNMKNSFAKYASDYFTRIPYTDFDNIERILDDKLKEILEHRQAFNETLEEYKNNIEAETEHREFKNYLYRFFE